MKDAVVGVIYKDLKKDKVLITKRCDVPVWVLPSGGIEAGETPERALLREIQEETSLKCAIIRKTGEYSPINRLARTTHVYECEILGGELRLSAETVDIAFHPVDKLPSSLFFLHQEWLEDARKETQSVIRRPIDNVTYWELLKYSLQHPVLVTRALLSRAGFPINARQST